MSGNSWRVSGINKESDAGAGTHGCTGGMTVTSCIACVSLGLPVGLYTHIHLRVTSKTCLHP